MISGIAALLAILHATLDAPGRIKDDAEDKRRFLSLCDYLETFRHEMRINPASLPAWLTEDAYTRKIQPLLPGIATPVIMSVLGVSGRYAVAIRAGRCRTHPRHWQALAELVGTPPHE